MTKRDLLKDCISIAHDTGVFGDYVFVYNQHTLIALISGFIWMVGNRGRLLIYIFQFTKKRDIKMMNME